MKKQLLALPKPKDIRTAPVAVIKLRDGVERCNLRTKEGYAIYKYRKRQMWERQGRKCCLHGHIRECPGNLSWAESTFDHEVPRGHGGALRDDRIEVQVKQLDGTVKIKWQNGAAHALCNHLKGSRRIDYNAAHNASVIAIKPKSWRCVSCDFFTTDQLEAEAHFADGNFHVGIGIELKGEVSE